MGATHGKAGFDAFTKQLPVLRQARWAASDLLKPPYAGVVDRLVRFLAR
jgi:coniferyl-aldehyde dehydrogenase